MSMHAAPARGGTVSRALARDKLGVLAVLAFILASIAPMTVAAGVIPTAYAITGLDGIPGRRCPLPLALLIRADGRRQSRRAGQDAAEAGPRRQRSATREHTHARAP